MKIVDTHAHIFSRHGAFIADARYRPSTDATVTEYLTNLDRHGIQYGVLIQPSFFGVDNSEMLAAITAHPDRLKGIAVVPTDIDAAALQSLTRQGIVGARLNLFGKPLPNLRDPRWQAFLSRAGQQGWQLELHCPPDYLRTLLSGLADYAGPVVIDHLGRVDPAKGIADADYRAALSMLDPERHWVKVSGYYRLGHGDQGERHAHEALQLLLERGMHERLVWGSDWPHTQHDDQVHYDATIGFLNSLIPNEALRMRVLGDNALKLFGFAP
ncbi:amidohydrolase family protein [Paracandidimonas lactea]|uniref:amidohydrolase family protein n=1 Tax=Paracandidimonas lactea TaxID=2895524 RepID=UPI001F2847A4|nr:amidohydrolase family protein [Paracandidimonas lactea]